MGNQARCLAFLNAVVWILRSGTQWRLLPESLGHWNSVFKRFSHWCEKGVWNEIHARCVDQPDLQAVFIDIQAVTDALGNPLDFILTGGQASDIG